MDLCERGVRRFHSAALWPNTETQKEMKGLVLFLFALASFAAEPPRKQLGGPPSEFAMMELPNPLDVYQVESSVMYQLPLQVNHPH